MPGLRYSIGGLMGAVVVAAVGLAALRSHSEAWAGGMLLLTCGTLALAVVGAVARRGARRIGWLGFSLFGWGYLFLSGCGADYCSSMLPTTWPLEVLGGWLGVPGRPRGVGLTGCMLSGLDPNFSQIGHCLWALVAASIGGLLARSFSGPARDPTEERPPRDEAAGPAPRGRWFPPMVAGLAALILAGAIATMQSGAGALTWAGMTFAMTCAFHGLAILGAILGRGRRRAPWIGAALFGAGYTALIFSRPVSDLPQTHLATGAILEGLRARLAPVVESLSRPTARIREALERPIPMRFPGEVPLGDLLDYIKRETASPSEPSLAIYVDPLGLQEAERSMASTVTIDLDGVPLRETLRLCLNQLGLIYVADHGYLRITSEGQVTSPDIDDPFLIVGHCLLSLMAAGFGARIAPMVAESGSSDPS